MRIITAKTKNNTQLNLTLNNDSTTIFLVHRIEFYAGTETSFSFDIITVL